MANEGRVILIQKALLAPLGEMILDEFGDVDWGLTDAQGFGERMLPILYPCWLIRFRGELHPCWLLFSFFWGVPILFVQAFF